jgi:soluble lytic murein transglycosylase-like protein
MKQVGKQIKFVYVVVCLLIIFLGNKLYHNTSDYNKPSLYNMGQNSDAPTSLKMYYLIEKYSTEYSIPKYIAYNVAYLETGYRGPFHWRYNPHQVSFAGALGPMQIMPKTGEWLTDGESTTKKLKMDIEFNINLSMKMLRWLHDRYGDWAIVCGYYNTGYPKVNDYGHYCATNKKYKDKWIKIDSELVID